MKIALTQIQPLGEEIVAIVEMHCELIKLASAFYTDWVLFPELSLTGYEHALDGELAISLDNDRFGIFQKLADRRRMKLGVGIALRQEAKVCIGAVLFSPGQPRRFYAKHCIQTRKLFLRPDIIILC
jgi:predicted amidohydrolase